ncbi:Carboxyl-terminal-processing protease [Triticum urartu]|uniref:Carboxyl-terminal-processing protease n=1 Tax=Triticum urartu TaxID=4572 RepID=M7Z276_TRIUA|nr:Carboxyl-terminal-processing protease [Triticum urartu]
MALAVSLSAPAYCRAPPPSSALTEENLLFLEAWRAVDRAYYDKSFNGQSWFSKSGTQGALTGVGLSIGYPLALKGSPAGLSVMSAAPGGPAEKAGIVSGDVILAIDDTSAQDMDIYDAADRLQGPEGSSIDLTILSGADTRHVVLKRERYTLNPVRSRMCEIPGSEDSSKIGYIKLTTFNQNAAGSVKEAIKKLRENNVKAFVLDLRNNSGGLFPEGIEIAKIWMDKGVIVYICDSRGVRDIYEADGASTIAASEPLVVLVRATFAYNAVIRDFLDQSYDTVCITRSDLQTRYQVNKGTASASEILAGALKDNKRAVVYGEPTYGKGYRLTVPPVMCKIQSVFALSDGSGLAVTVARYETPAHTDIDKVGVTPDRPLPASFPTDEDGFCSCLRDPASCNLNAARLFARS